MAVNHTPVGQCYYYIHSLGIVLYYVLLCLKLLRVVRTRFTVRIILFHTGCASFARKLSFARFRARYLATLRRNNLKEGSRWREARRSMPCSGVLQLYRARIKIMASVFENIKTRIVLRFAKFRFLMSSDVPAIRVYDRPQRYDEKTAEFAANYYNRGIKRNDR